MCVIRGTYIDVNHVRCTGTIQSTHGFRVRAETRTSYLYDPRTYGYVAWSFAGCSSMTMEHIPSKNTGATLTSKP